MGLTNKKEPDESWSRKARMEVLFSGFFFVRATKRLVPSVNRLKTSRTPKKDITVFENHRKSLIQHCELLLHFEWTKVIKNAKNSQFDKSKTCYLRSNSVTRQITFNRTKIGEKCQNWKIQMRHLWMFSNTVNLEVCGQIGLPHR